jgi:hypothetical protein
MSRRAAVSLLLLSACGPAPVSVSSPVGIELKAKSGDVSGSTVSELKEINTESGNPYGAFIASARSKLGGKDPSKLTLDQLTLTLGGQSTGVATLDQVVTGDVDVAFVVDSSNNTYDAGHLQSPTGAGPVAATVTFDWAAVSTADRAAMLGGSFKVALRGPSAASFSGKGAEAQLEVSFTFDAFE